MILYHGSNVHIESIDLNESRVGKDFGVGFYLTPDRSVAEKQAMRRADIEGGYPIVSAFELDEKGMSSCKILEYEGYSVSWAEFVRANRNNRTRQQLHEYDIVIGPIANDDIGMQMRKFNAGRITIEGFMKAIEWKEVTVQYFFSTPEAIKLLRKI